MDRGGFLSGTVRAWLGRGAEAFALFRASMSARRRVANAGARIPHGYGSTAAIGFLLACGATGFFLGGHYDRMRETRGPFRDMVARAFGFGISHIGVTGQHELTQEEVIALSGLGPLDALPFLDPKEVQSRLVKVPMIAEASVRKLYPDRLLIDIKERVPFALWQREGQVLVVAADGTAIEPFNDARFMRLPHVVGVDANLRLREYVALLEAVPEIAPKVRAGTLVSGRRWTLKLVNGIDVKLPEIEPEVALRAFAALDREGQISERDLLAIDLRVPGRAFVRLREEAAAAHAEHVIARIKKAGGRV